MWWRREGWGWKGGEYRLRICGGGRLGWMGGKGRRREAILEEERVDDASDGADEVEVDDGVPGEAFFTEGVRSVGGKRAAEPRIGVRGVGAVWFQLALERDECTRGGYESVGVGVYDGLQGATLRDTVVAKIQKASAGLVVWRNLSRSSPVPR
ncbi:hypothetical protein K439DRAFT_1536300 [Ramaria rubella]|nr:hypothetical protein K439DRAFT_1536300 [Ramaria rubella]